MSQAHRALVALFIMTACWGATFPFIHEAVHDCSPSLFAAIRNVIAALALLPIVISRLKHTQRRLIWHALVLGILNGFANVAQTTGLQTITASSSAFITAISVILVPFFMPLLKLDRLRPVDFIAALITLLGVYILTQSQFSNNWQGNAWTLASALSYALYITSLSKFTQYKQNILLLVFYQLIISALFPVCVLPFETSYFSSTTSVWSAIIFCGVVGTSIGLLLQNYYQRFIHAATATIIYAFEPIFASVFAFWLIQEEITRHTMIGGAIIIIGFLLSQCFQTQDNT